MIFILPEGDKLVLPLDGCPSRNVVVSKNNDGDVLFEFPEAWCEWSFTVEDLRFILEKFGEPS